MELDYDGAVAGVEVLMLWERGLAEIHDAVRRRLEELARTRIGGFDDIDIIISWGGNDVFGEYGYAGFTWHKSGYAVQSADVQIQARNWPAKQLEKVQSACDQVALLRKHPLVRTVTVVSGPSAEAYGLPLDYNMYMSRRLSAMEVDGLVDPFPLLVQTSRRDHLHFDDTLSSRKVVTDFWGSLTAAIVQLKRFRSVKHELAANQRKLVFDRHFHRGLCDPLLYSAASRNIKYDFSSSVSERLRTVLPEESDLIIPDGVAVDSQGELAPRDEDEEIVMNEPRISVVNSVLAFCEVPPEDELEPITEQEEALLPTTQENREQFIEAREATIMTFVADAADVVLEDSDIEKAEALGISPAEAGAVAPDAEEQGEEQRSFIQALADERQYEEGGRTDVKAMFRAGAPLPDYVADPPEQPPHVMSVEEDAFAAAHGGPAPTNYKDPNLNLTSEEVDPMFRRAERATVNATLADKAITWIDGSELPTLRSRLMTENARFALSKKLSFVLRGWALERNCGSPPFCQLDGSALLVDLLQCMNNCYWRGCATSQILDVMKNSVDKKCRFLVGIVETNASSNLTSDWWPFQIVKVKAASGHSSNVLSEGSDLRSFFAEARACQDNVFPADLSVFPQLRPQPWVTERWKRVPELLFHGAKKFSVTSILEQGLLPGGSFFPSGDGRLQPARGMTMFSKSSLWERTTNAGLRPNAEIEFIVDAQLALAEGCRFFCTPDGVVHCPDWISNRFFLAVADRCAQQIVWSNRAYEHTRKAFVDCERDGRDVFVTDVIDEAHRNGGTFYHFLVTEQEHNFGGWGPEAASARSPQWISPLRAVHVHLSNTRACFRTAPPVVCSEVIAVIPARRPEGRATLRSLSRVSDWRHNLLHNYARLCCPNCGMSNKDGFHNCPECHLEWQGKTDLLQAVNIQLAKLRAEATGRDFALSAIRLGPGVQANRVRSGGRAHASGPVVVRNTAKRLMRNQEQYGSLAGRVRADPFFSYNMFAVGITGPCLEFVETMGYMILPQGTRTSAQIAAGLGADQPSRFAVSYRPGSEVINLAKNCFVAFWDRFFHLGEYAILHIALKANGHDLTIYGVKQNLELSGTTPVTCLNQLCEFAAQEQIHYWHEGDTYKDFPVERGCHMLPPPSEPLTRGRLNDLLRGTPFASWQTRSDPSRIITILAAKAASPRGSGS
jgi:RNA:NAD 2'-phosphotransferase (TPT1/KptA family)